jgi:ubiquinone/menaquinone biosynthesis C-methylase UbiE
LFEDAREAQTNGDVVPTWYECSADVVDQFQTAAERHRIFGVISSDRPLYDRIMGDFEHRSNRAALRGPMDDDARSIVDVGCGTGHLLGLVAERYQTTANNLLAIDLSQNMLDQSRNFLKRTSRLFSFVSFHWADCRALPLQDATCDLYVSSYLFDMLPEEELTDALSEMRRVLKPGGQALLLTMTLEVDEMPWLLRQGARAANAFYNLGYRNGRWNAIWGGLFSGYAPHCRPIELGARIKDFPDLHVQHSSLSRVMVFPVRILYVRRSVV